MIARHFAHLTIMTFFASVSPAHAVPTELVGNTLVCPMDQTVTAHFYVTRQSVFYVSARGNTRGTRYDFGRVRSDQQPGSISYRSIARATQNRVELMAEATSHGHGGTQLRMVLFGQGGSWRLTAAGAGQTATVACTLHRGRVLGR